jgi:hypothetical protein
MYLKIILPAEIPLYGTKNGFMRRKTYPETEQVCLCFRSDFGKTADFSLTIHIPSPVCRNCNKDR